MSHKFIRGFAILHSAQNPAISIKLTAQDGRRYFVIISKFFIGIKYSTKYYEFDDLGTARYVYRRLEQQKISSTRSKKEGHFMV